MSELFLVFLLFTSNRYKLTGKFFNSRYVLYHVIFLSIFYHIFLSPLITAEKIEPQSLQTDVGNLGFAAGKCEYMRLDRT